MGLEEEMPWKRAETVDWLEAHGYPEAASVIRWNIRGYTSITHHLDSEETQTVLDEAFAAASRGRPTMILVIAEPE